MSGEDVFDQSNTVPLDTGTLTPAPSGANLLEVSESQAAARMLADWDLSYKDIQPLKAQWDVNRHWAAGFSGARVIKQQNDARFYLPLNSPRSSSGKANRLRRRLRSTIFADPPVPDAVPGSGSDEDRDAAEVSTRVLTDLTSEGGIDYALAAGEAFDRGADYGSGFIRFWTNPEGGGYRKKQIEAHPQAVSVEDALSLPPTDGAYPLRYVKEDGTLTDEPDDPAIVREWLPKVDKEILTGKHVRFLPFTATDIWDCDGLMVGSMIALGTLRAMFPRILGAMREDEMAKIVSARPQHADDLIPMSLKNRSQEIKDDALVFVLTRYHKQSGKYPQGCYAMACGTDTMLHRGVWYDEQHDKPMDIPVTQFKHFVDEGNPYGRGVMDVLGPGNELLARITDMILTQADRMGQRKTFLPMHSNLTPQQLQSPTGAVLNIIPGGEPKYEEIPDIPAIYEKLLNITSAELDDESGLQAPAQGVHEPGVDSAKHANTLIEQSLTGLSDLVQHSNRAITRGWRIMLQLVRRDYTIPQQIGWVGEDGSYKVKDFLGSDLGSTKDVRIAKGSFTQLSPASKAGLAQSYAQLGLLPPDDLKRVLQSNLGGTLGLQDNPHQMKVRRQIAAWEEGPPEDWAPQPPQIDPATGQQIPVPDPVLSAIFQPCPVDDQQDIALIRVAELGRAIAGTRYTKWPQPWQQGLQQEYLKARMAAGIQTIAEQQQAQQAQAQAQQQAQQQQAQQADADRQAKVSGEDKKLALEQQKMELEMVREQAKAAAEAQRASVKEQMGGPMIQQVHQMPKGFKVQRNELGEIEALETVQ